MIPVEIRFCAMDPSPAAETAIRDWVSRLEHAHSEIERCAVFVELPHRRHRHGKTFAIHIVLTVPDRTIAITRDPGLDDSHEDVYVAITDAFRKARRALMDYARIRRREVKQHAAAQ